MKLGIKEFAQKELPERVVLITCGLPASGKTITSGIIAQEKGFEVLRSDIIRLHLLEGEDIFDEKIASDMNRRMAVYEEMFRQAEEIARSGMGVILDATFVTQELRRRAARIAAQNNACFVIQENIAPEDVCLKRISERTKEDYQSNAISPEAYSNNAKKFEKIDLDDLREIYPDLSMIHFVVDSSDDDVSKWHVIMVDRRFSE